MKLTEYFKTMLTSTITSFIYQINISKSSIDQKDLPKSQYLTPVVPSNRRDPSLEGGHSTKIDGMWNLKHEKISPKFYELFIKTEFM